MQFNQVDMLEVLNKVSKGDSTCPDVEYSTNLHDMYTNRGGGFIIRAGMCTFKFVTRKQLNKENGWELEPVYVVGVPICMHLNCFA